MRGSREISLVPSLHRASTDALIMKVFGFVTQLLARTLYRQNKGEQVHLYTV